MKHWLYVIIFTATASGIESFSKLEDSIYFEEVGKVAGLCIIQYISSSLNWKSGQISLNQKVEPVVASNPLLQVALTISSEAQYILVLCSFKEQLQQHVRVHAVEHIQSTSMIGGWWQWCCRITVSYTHATPFRVSGSPFQHHSPEQSKFIIIDGIQKMLSKDLPQLAMELSRVENIRSYAVIGFWKWS
ncbi:hypothetical protein ACSBR1_023886 [Camellia fascicularis]